MTYGCCHLSIVPVRKEASDSSEMVTQLLFGDIFEILDDKNSWLKVKNTYDDYVGWIDYKQSITLNTELYSKLKANLLLCSTDFVEYVEDINHLLSPIVMGSSVIGMQEFKYSFNGNLSRGIINKNKIVETALLYLNSPYLWGGKTPFGIDCSGFTQMVYKICGIKLKRDAYEQATQGHNLSFIEEALPGDLAFFDNAEGKIIHVGIIMKNNYIIHAHGKVRIDRLDHNGIFNPEAKNYSHKLRVIKQI